MIRKFLSRFAAKRPNAASMEEWDEWEITTRKEQPIRMFLFDDVPRWFSIKYTRWFKEPKQWVMYRTFERMHIVKPKSLKAGYICRSDRMLHTAFHELVSYVEGSLGYRNWEYWNVDRPDGMSSFKWRLHKNYRPANKENLIEAALAHLDWEITDPQVPQHQKAAAMEFKALYLWWTVDRPQRIDPWYDKESKLMGIETPEDKALHEGKGLNLNFGLSTRAYFDAIHALEDFYNEQDQTMLEALVKVRTRID